MLLQATAYELIRRRATTADITTKLGNHRLPGDRSHRRSSERRHAREDRIDQTERQSVDSTQQASCTLPEKRYGAIVLKSIWKLDNVAAATTFATAGSFDTYLKSSRWVENAIVRPEAVIGPRVGVRDKQFTKVDFRHCVFRQVTFTRCRFVDCIFLGALFEECEFHDCRFVDCNMWKPTFDKVYLDPSSFSFSKPYRQDFPNVPLVMYDRLYQVVRENERLEHLLMADIQRRRWKRRETFYKARRERNLRLWWRYGLNLLLDGISEYGYAPIRFLIISLALFTVFAIPVHVWWSDLGFQRQGRPVVREGFGLTLFYCASLFTTLGYSDLVPINGLGRAVSTAIAFVGIGWSGLFTAILVRKVLR